MSAEVRFGSGAMFDGIARRYDALNRVTTITDAKGGMKRLGWNAQAQLAAYTDCSGRTTRYRYDGWDFARLILAVAEVPGVQRVRFTSPHPKDFPAALLDAVAGHPHICKHIHLPLQSGNDRILELMNRTYSRKEYLDLAATIRRRHPGIALTTDIICGFCSESEEEFLDTYRVVEEVQYHSAYVFKYSERKNTIAARKFPDDVPDIGQTSSYKILHVHR